MAFEEGDLARLLMAVLAPLLLSLAVHYVTEPKARTWHQSLVKSP